MGTTHKTMVKSTRQTTIAKSLMEKMFKGFPVSRERFVEEAKICTSNGPSTDRLGKFTSKCNKEALPKMDEVANMITWFHENKMKNEVEMLHSYFFGKIGVLNPFEIGESCSELSTCILTLAAAVGNASDAYIEFLENDGIIDDDERQQLDGLLTRLEEKVKNAKRTLHQ